MKIFKIIAVASALAILSACAEMGYERPYADRTSYVAPRASMDPAMSGLPGAGAAGGGGAGAVRR